MVLTGHTSALDKWSLFVEQKIVDYCTSGLGSTEICLDILGLGLGLSDFIFIEYILEEEALESLPLFL